jgi:acetyl-CoA C-acetyltransferase
MQEAVIVSAVRTPVGSFAGQFKDVSATELGTHAVRSALDRVGVGGEEVDEVMLGCVLQAGLGQNPARQAAIGAGIPKEVPATTINMLCGSGLKSVAIASQMIRAGDVEVVVAGGMENMTRAPYLLPTGRFGARMGAAQMIDSMISDGLWDAFNDIHMGITGENVADMYQITREEQDEFAVASQQRAERAINDGVFKDEIAPIEVPDKAGLRRSTRTRPRGPALRPTRLPSCAPPSARTAAP